MRKGAVLLLTGCLALSTPVLAAETDVTGMDYSTLSELKQKL